MLSAFSATMAFFLAAMISTNAAMTRGKFDDTGHTLIYASGACILACTFSLGVLFERWMQS